MCCCDKPTINGEPGCKMTFESSPSVYTPNPPDLQDGDVLLFDEPGRCGGSDSHAYHFRVTVDCGRVFLLVRHGGGDERMEFGWKKTTLPALESLDSNARYWLLCAAYHGMKDRVEKAVEDVEYKWRSAAAEKRIKTRKQPRRGFIKVWIDPKAQKEVTA